MALRSSLLDSRPLCAPVLVEHGCRMWQQACTLLLPQLAQYSSPLILEMKVRTIYHNSNFFPLIIQIGGAPITSWAFRACVIQGTQQIYVTFLWYWGSSMAAASQAGSTKTSLADSNPRLLIGIGLGIAFFLWTIGALIFFGLPEYYRQAPGQVPAFYRTLLRRKVVLVCFMNYVCLGIQDIYDTDCS